MSSALTIRIDDATLGALNRLAEATERPRDWLVTQAIQDYVAQNAWASSKIEGGVTAADAGDFAHPEDAARVRAKFAQAE